MSDQLKKALIGAVIAVALAAAASYGLISQQTADKLKADADQALSDRQPAPPQSPAPAPANPVPPQTQPSPQNSAAAPRP